MPIFVHRPVLETEVLAALRPEPGGFYVDGTAGGGSHAEAILRASNPSGRLFGCDRDGLAVEAARARLSGYGTRAEIRRGNFADLLTWLAPASAHGVLLDLGVSSPQLDRPERGFSFQQEGPLDMRMDTRQALTAATLVNELSEEELARIFWDFGDEPQGRRFARAIVREREIGRFETTGALASLIEKLAPRRGQKRHPATRVFQALRMAVNDESRSLKSGLAAACSILRPGGRLVVITFHSIEDRAVKEFGRTLTRDYTVDGPVDIPELRRPCAPVLRWVNRKAVQPALSEVEANPRARSAQLRAMEKI